jgi:hypothetical protein
MEAGGGHEVGVWVSGFYGSGKSSFTKYLGLAFDQGVRVDGQPFLRHLQDRLHKATTKALLATVAARFPAAVARVIALERPPSPPWSASWLKPSSLIACLCCSAQAHARSPPVRRADR